MPASVASAFAFVIAWLRGAIDSEENETIHRLRAFGPRLITLILAVFILIAASVPSADAYQHRRRRHNPEAGKGKAAKRIGIGAAIGAGAGGLIGGRKGAVIGAGAGAGAGAAYHVHKKRSWRRHHRRG